MNTRRLPTVTVLLALVTGAVAFEGRVIGIVDGDTITVLANSAGGVQRPVRVRLNGSDAPEREQPFSARAKQFVAQLAFGQVVEIVVQTTTAMAGPSPTSSYRTAGALTRSSYEPGTRGGSGSFRCHGSTPPRMIATVSCLSGSRAVHR